MNKRQNTGTTTTDSKTVLFNNRKFTYNLITDPRIKRGPNFGVEFVTNSTVEFNDSVINRKFESTAKSSDTTLLHKTKKTTDDLRDVPPPEGRCHLGVNTTKVVDTVRPKPLTFEVEVQTKDFIDRPQTPLFWPQKTGEDKETQVEDGELFDFDVEVEPIVNVLTSKILEQARMEVLEEEEISEMKRQQKEFEIKRNRELQEVQKLENEETRKTEERSRRAEEKQLRITMTIVNQKKLFSRIFAKEYLSKLKSNSTNQLLARGVFKNPELNQYHNSLLPQVRRQAEEHSEKDYVIVTKLHDTFQRNLYSKKIVNHRQAITNERIRKETVQRERIEEMERVKQEKIRVREEAKRIQKEKELALLRGAINEDVLTTVEFVDEVHEIYDINAYHRKSKHTPAIGGHLTQLALVITYINAVHPDSLTEEKIQKILESYLPTSPPFYFLYTNENLESYKEVDPTIGSIEDIFRSDESLFIPMVNLLIDNTYHNDEMLHDIFEELTKRGYEGVHDMFDLIFKILLKLLKATTDVTLVDKIKFILKDQDAAQMNYSAVCLFSNTIISRMKTPEVSQPVIPSKKFPDPKKQAPVKITFEHFLPNKAVIMSTFSDKIRILAVNNDYERMLRYNILECIFKLYKVDPEKEAFLNNLEENYLTFVEDLSSKLAANFKTDKLLIHIEAPNS